MDDRDLFKIQKEMLAELFSQARAYTNVVIVAGYAGAFAIWNFLSDRLAPATALGVGLLLCISLSTYVAWEIYAMIQKQVSMAALRAAVDNFGRYSDEVRAHQEKNQLLLRRFARYWPITMFVAVGSAALAIAMLISAFCQALILQFIPRLFAQGVEMDVLALFVVLGGIVAGAAGVVAFRYEARRNYKRSQKMYSSAIQDEMRTSIGLFNKLIDTWNEEAYITFLVLDEIDFSRATFLSARADLQLLDSDMRQRISNYYRESAVTLQRLRNNQEDFYRVNGAVVGEEELEKKEEMLSQRKSWIESGIEMLKSHQVQADQVATQLFLRY